MGWGKSVEKKPPHQNLLIAAYPELTIKHFGKRSK